MGTCICVIHSYYCIAYQFFFLSSREHTERRKEKASTTTPLYGDVVTLQFLFLHVSILTGYWAHMHMHATRFSSHRARIQTLVSYVESSFLHTVLNHCALGPALFFPTISETRYLLGYAISVSFLGKLPLHALHFLCTGVLPQPRLVNVIPVLWWTV